MHFPEITVDEQDSHIQSHASILTLARDALHLQPEVVYYYCCGIDVSPSIAFQGSKILYVDVDRRCMRALRKRGYLGIIGDAERFRPKRTPDLELTFMAYCSEAALQHLKVGGYFITDGAYGTLESAVMLPNFALVAVVLFDDQYHPVRVSTERMEDYRTKVQSDEELIAADGCGSYREFYLRHAEARSNYLDAHARLVAQAIQRTQENHDQILLAQPWLKPKRITEQNTIYLQPKINREEVRPLPFRKRTGAYIFQRLF